MRVEGSGARGRRLGKSRFLVRPGTCWRWFTGTTASRRTRRNTVTHLRGRVRVIMRVCGAAIGGIDDIVRFIEFVP